MKIDVDLEYLLGLVREGWGREKMSFRIC